MLLVWGLLLTCASVSVSADIVRVKAGRNLTLNCSTAYCLKGLKEINGMYEGMFLCRDNERVTYYDYNPNNTSSGQFSAITNNNAPRIVKKGSFEEHSIDIINVTVNDSGFYRCVAIYSIKKHSSPTFKSNTSCNMYRVDIVRETDSEVSTPSSPVSESPPAAQPFLPIIITATVSVLITMIFTLCFIPKIKHWSCSRESRDIQTPSNDLVYEVMTRNGFRPGTERLHRPTA